MFLLKQRKAEGFKDKRKTLEMTGSENATVITKSLA